MGDVLRFFVFLLVLSCAAGFFYQLGVLIFDRVRGNDFNWHRAVWVIVCGAVCVIVYVIGSLRLQWIQYNRLIGKFKILF